jgi:hypothetical protein
MCYNETVLKQLRQKKVMKRVLWGLALIIIPAFVLWGAGGLREQGRYAGVIFGQKIAFDEYRDSYNAVRNLALLTHGSDFHKVREALRLEESAWDRLILVKEAKQKNIKISDEDVIARIAALSLFQTKEGFFNQNNYVTILNNILRTTPRRFEEEMRESLMIERLMAGIFRNIPEPTESEIEEAMSMTAPEEGEEETEDAAVQRREKVKENLLVAKRMEAYQAWRDELYARAKFVSFIEPPEEEPAEEEPAEKEEKPAETEAEAKPTEEKKEPAE